MEGYKELRFFKPMDNHEGTLTVIEKNRNLPFHVKRIFYICGAPKALVRGMHAHKKLKHILFCPSGGCDFILDDGRERLTIEVRTPDHGIYIYGCIWLEFTNFSPGCVVMCLASEEYDESDYIRDYNDFLGFIRYNG